MKHKKIILLSLIVIAMASVFGAFAVNEANSYDPFDDPKYANNISTATEDSIIPDYSGLYSYTTIDDGYPERTFREVLYYSDSIIIGTVDKVSYVLDGSDVHHKSVCTDYHISIDENLKGSLYDDVIVTTYGGQSGDHATLYDDDMFVFQEDDTVLLMISHVGMSKSEIANLGIDEPCFEWSPSGMYKILGDEPNREVHQYGKKIFVPLSDFIHVIRSNVNVLSFL